MGTPPKRGKNWEFSSCRATSPGCPCTLAQIIGRQSLVGTKPQIPGSPLTICSCSAAQSGHGSAGGSWWLHLTAPTLPSLHQALPGGMSGFPHQVTPQQVQFMCGVPHGPALPGRCALHGRWFVMGSAWCWGQAKPCNRCSEIK